MDTPEPLIEDSNEPAASTPDEASLHSSLSRRRQVLVVASVMLGMLLGALDQTIVGTAMPHIIAELQGLEHYAWVFTAYMLASTVMVPTYGKLSDIYGRRPFFLGGMVLFLLGSALSGTSQDMTQLIVYRAIQGLGAGALLPIVQAIIGDVFPPVERGRWQGIMMAVFGLASIVGPTAGGWITDNWGWRWVFYVNMPVGAVAFVVAALALPGQSRRTTHAIDYLGAVTLVAATVPLLLAFSWAGTTYPWSAAIIIELLAFAAVMGGVFFVVEGRAAEPIISPRFFRSSIFTVSVVATFLVSVGMYGAIMYLPLFVQGVLNHSATSSGVVLTPMMLGFMASSIIGGQIMSRTGRYKALALIGFGVATIGMFWLSRMGVDATDALVVRNMVITGLGLGVMMSLFTIVVQNAFPFQQLGQVTASLQFFRSIGGTIGVAIMGSVMANGFQSALRSNLPSALTRVLPSDRLAALQNPQVLLAPAATAQLQRSFDALGPAGPALFQQFLHALRLSLAQAIGGIFLLGAGVMLVGLLASAFLREIPLRHSHVEPVAPEYLEDMNLTPEAVVQAVSIAGRRGAAIGLILLALIGLVALVGYPQGTLTASVTWQGRPLPAVTIRWIPSTGTAAPAADPAATPPARSTPRPSATATGPPEVGSSGPSYRIRPGDSLASISQAVCGTPDDWPKIYQANRSRISDPDQLRPGQTLILPPC